MDIESVLAQVIAFLAWAGSLALVVQTAINTLKPSFITPIKNRLEAEGRGEWYLSVFYLFRLLITLFGFLFVWGGVDAVRTILPSADFIPDLGLAIGTIFLVVSGQEVIHPLMDRLYIIGDTIKMLEIDIDTEDENQQNKSDVSPSGTSETTQESLG